MVWLVNYLRFWVCCCLIFGDFTYYLLFSLLHLYRFVITLVCFLVFVVLVIGLLGFYMCGVLICIWVWVGGGCDFGFCNLGFWVGFTWVFSVFLVFAVGS